MGPVYLTGRSTPARYVLGAKVVPRYPSSNGDRGKVDHGGGHSERSTHPYGIHSMLRDLVARGEAIRTVLTALERKLLEGTASFEDGEDVGTNIAPIRWVYNTLTQDHKTLQVGQITLRVRKTLIRQQTSP